MWTCSNFGDLPMFKIWQNLTPTWAAPPFPSPALSSSWRYRRRGDVQMAGVWNLLEWSNKWALDRPKKFLLIDQRTGIWGLEGGCWSQLFFTQWVWCFPLNPRGKYGQSVGSRSTFRSWHLLPNPPIASTRQHWTMTAVLWRIGWWLVVSIYPFEKYESVGMTKFPTEWKVIKNPCVNHVFPYINHIFMINQYWTWFQTTNQHGLVHAFTKPSERAAGSMKRNATP